MKIIDNIGDWWSYSVIQISVRKHFPNAGFIIIGEPSYRTSTIIIDGVKYLLKFSEITYDGDMADICWEVYFDGYEICRDSLAIPRSYLYHPTDIGIDAILINNTDDHKVSQLIAFILEDCHINYSKLEIKEGDEYHVNFFLDEDLYKVLILNKSFDCCSWETSVAYHFIHNDKVLNEDICIMSDFF